MSQPPTAQREFHPGVKLARLASFSLGVYLLAQTAIGYSAERPDKPWLHSETRMRLFSPAWHTFCAVSPAARRGRDTVVQSLSIQIGEL